MVPPNFRGDGSVLFSLNVIGFIVTSPRPPLEQQRFPGSLLRALPNSNIGNLMFDPNAPS